MRGAFRDIQASCKLLPCPWPAIGSMTYWHKYEAFAQRSTAPLCYGDIVLTFCWCISFVLVLQFLLLSLNHMQIYTLISLQMYVLTRINHRSRRRNLQAVPRRRRNIGLRTTRNRLPILTPKRIRIHWLMNTYSPAHEYVFTGT